ncbi:MAG: DUF1565 domain-containing protein [Pseudanabaenaceae cyanobacterium bins.39]|nr:DUF1565 domain-containing protein [Pseudanabaenaceae cyanobacterium bins.39]
MKNQDQQGFGNLHNGYAILRMGVSCALGGVMGTGGILMIAFPAIASTPPKIIYISPQGVDTATSGTTAQPFRTISAAIANHPQAGNIFQLSQGGYDQTTGEVFPIILPKGTTLRGNPLNNGSNVVINGGGRFVSSTFASQNIAIVAGNQSRIEGVTVTNNNPRGYGVWLESSQKVAIANNNFLRNTHDGIFLTGRANAYIQNNLFAGNTGSGISAVGSSTGEIRDNRFENTGFGLSIGQQSQVILVNNNISRNVDGIIISNVAQPTLRGNTIIDNQRNGLVILNSPNGAPRPDLGTKSSIGNNTFRNNRELDINNATTIPIVAVGNQINLARVRGRLDLQATTSPIANNIITSTTSTPSNVVSLNNTQITAAPTAIQPISSSANSPSPVLIPIPAPPNTAALLPSPVISSTSNPSSNPQTIVIERAYGNPSPIATALPVPLDPNTGKALQYRVIVPNTSAMVTQQVKAIVPDAFRLSQRGRAVLQVGAYSDRATAEAQVQKLSQAGLRAEVIPFP